MSLGSRMSSMGSGGVNDESDFQWDESILGDMHLNSAINLDLLKHFYKEDTPKYRVKEDNRVTKELRELEDHCKKRYAREIGFQKLFGRMFEDTEEMSPMSSILTRMIMKIINKSSEKYNLSIPIGKVTEEMIQDGCNVPKGMLDWFKFFLYGIYSRSEWIRSEGMNVLFNSVLQGGFLRRKYTMGDREYVFFIGKEVVEIRIPQEKLRYVADFNSLLLLLDVSGQRICAHLCSSLGRRMSIPGSLGRESLSRICRLGDSLVEEMGNGAYEILGMYESMCVGTLLSKSPDKVADNNQFSENCDEETEEMIQGTERPERVREIVTGIKQCLREMEATEISNAFCLYRIWGHPTVDIWKGMKKVHEIGTKDKTIPPNLGVIMVCQFRKMFLSTYFKKHHSYPNLRGEPKGYLKTCIDQKVPIRIDHPGYNIRDFEDIKIQETYRVPETFDMCHILNDKAVSPDLDELVESIKAGKGTSCGAKRRGILRWMEGESVNCRKFLEEVSKNGLKDSEHLIGMYEKEREIKVAARMYSLMTENMRYYFVLTEGLIADYILPHFPEITMKDSLNVLIKKMWESGGQRSLGTRDININLDFSKWNTNMRNALTHLTFSEMDSIFGFENLISRTHDIFLKSMIYSASGKYLPHLVDGAIQEDGHMCYKGHQGGFEGLRQKGWTVATVCLLAYLAEQQQVGMKLMGQGDNQIIRLKMPNSYWMSLKLSDMQMNKEALAISDKFVEAMDIIFSGAGLPIKVRETWRSSRLFMYGKVMLLDGRQLPQWYKKTLRSYALSNEGTLTISGVIGTIATNMCAAAGGSETPCLMYVLFLVLSEWSLSFMFKYHPFTRERIRDGETLEFQMIENGRRQRMTTKKVSSLWLKALIVLIPTAVGGSVTIPMTGYIMRGFPDKASEGYAWLKFLSTTGSPIQGFLKSFYTFMPNDTIEADMLVQSPFSLNHKRPPTPGLQTRENIRDWLLSSPRFQQNRFIKGMKELLGGFNKKKICRELLTDVMNPLITHEVFETFGQVYCEGIVSRVENTRTIRTMHLNREDREPIVVKLMEDEMSYIGYLWWRASNSGNIKEQCATKQARTARNIGWGRVISGITTPHPLEILFSRVCTPSRECIWDDDHITSKLVEGGRFPPFLGSKIKNKVYSLQDEEARREPLIKVGSRLARQFEWIDMGVNMRNLVMKNIGALCDVSVFDKFVDDDPSDNLYTGSVMHRFTPSSVSEGCFINYAPQLGHGVFMSSDTLPSLSRGQTNYTFHFQAMYCFLQYVIANSEEEGSYHHHVGCGDCVVPVEDDFDDIEESHPSIDSSQAEKYIKIIRDTLGYISQKPKNLVMRSEDTPIGIFADDVLGQEKQLSSGVVDILCWRSATDILSRTKDTYTSVGTEDLQGWPRIYSYKVSRKRVVGKVSAFLMMMIASKMREFPFEHNMERIRKRSLDVVSGVSIEGFSGIASLCLGRDYPFGDTVVTVVEGFAYPETVTVCLKSVKASLLMTIGKTMNLGRFMNKRCLYPTEMLTSKGFIEIMGYKATVTQRCTKIQEAIEASESGDINYSEVMCQHNCMRRMMKRNNLVNMTMDRAMKYLPILNHKIKMTPMSTRPISILCSQQLKMEFREFSDAFEVAGVKTFPELDRSHMRMIQFPTSSVYKWVDVMSRECLMDHVIVLGDGTGGTSMVVSKLFPYSSVYPMALLESKNLIPQDLDSLAPPMSRHYSNVNLKMLIDLPDDIRGPQFAKRLSDRVRKMEGRVLVISDIEGSGGILRTLIDMTKTLPCATYVIIKTYLSDLYKEYFLLSGMNELELLVSPLSNMRYGEVFIRFKVQKGTKRVCRSGIKPAVDLLYQKALSIPEDQIKNTMSGIESCFTHAVNTSVNITLMKVAGWGGSFPQTVLAQENMLLLGYLYQYMNTHYHFAGVRYRPGDNRTITPLRLESLTFLFCSFLLAVFGESSLIQDEVRSLTLIGRKDGIPGKEYLKMVVHNKGSQRELTADELRVGRVIRNYRGKILGIKIESGPVGIPFVSGAMLKIKLGDYKVPISPSGGWMEEHLQI